MVSMSLWGFEFIGAPFVCKTIQVSRAQFNKTSSVHCIVCPSPKQSPFLSLFIPPRPSPPPPAITILLSMHFVYIA